MHKPFILSFSAVCAFFDSLNRAVLLPDVIFIFTILAGALPRPFGEGFGKMRLRFKGKIACDLGKVEGGFLQQLFGSFDLHIQKVVDDAPAFLSCI